MTSNYTRGLYKEYELVLSEKEQVVAEYKCCRKSTSCFKRKSMRKVKRKQSYWKKRTDFQKRALGN